MPLSSTMFSFYPSYIWNCVLHRCDAGWDASIYEYQQFPFKALQPTLNLNHFFYIFNLHLFLHAIELNRPPKYVNKKNKTSRTHALNLLYSFITITWPVLCFLKHLSDNIFLIFCLIWFNKLEPWLLWRIDGSPDTTPGFCMFMKWPACRHDIEKISFSSAIS